MILVLALPVVVIVVVAVLVLASGSLGTGSLGSGQPRGALGGAGPFIVVGAGGFVVLLLLAALFMVAGLRSSSPPEPDAAPEPEAINPVAAQLPTAKVASRPRLSLAPPGGPGFDRPRPTLGGLSDGDVVEVVVTGFPSNFNGQVEQCRSTVRGFERCINAFPVRFDDKGSARFQYEVREPSARCGTPATCVVVVGGDGPPAWGRLIFGSAAPATSVVTIEPSLGLRPGDSIEIAIEGAPSGGRIGILQCPAKRVVPDGCVTITTAETLLVGQDGRAAAKASVREVGVCGVDRACGVAVVDETGSLLAPVVPLRYVATPGASYDGDRLLVGLLAAGLLLALAGWLVRSTDWREPSEASVA